MEKFAIYSPVMGLRKDFPSVLLDTSFMPDMQNVRFWNGEVRTAKMRRKQFLRQSFDATPVEGGTITVAGDVTSNFPACVAASLTTAIGVPNTELVFTAKAIGANGNAITIEYSNPGAINQPLSVSVAGSVIEFSLATDGAGAITTTADDIKALILATPEVTALITAVDAAANDGSGVVTAMIATHLSGGVSIDIAIFELAYGFNQVFTSATAQVTCAYDGWTGLTTFTSDNPAEYPIIFVAPAMDYLQPVPKMAYYTAEMETDPQEPDFLHIPVPDAATIMRFHDLLTDANELILFAFTPLHIYIWNTQLTEWLEAFEASATIEHWSTVSFNGHLIVTNNTDVPMVWTGLIEADSFEGLGGVGLGPEISAGGSTIDKAKFVTSFEGHVVFGNYELSTSDSYLNGIIWSDLDNHLEWKQDGITDAGAAYVEGEGIIEGGFGRKGDMLYVFKDRSARAFWYTADDFIFSSRAYLTSVGCVCPDSVVNDSDGNLYFYSSDMNFREVDLGIISQPLGDESRSIVQDKSILSQMRSAFIAEYGEVWWSVPYGSDATANNRIFCYKNGIWNIIEIAVSAFGQYRENANYTWDTLPFNSWDEWEWPSWDSVSGVSGWPLDICAGYDGLSYLSHGSYLDNGEAYESNFVLATDLGHLSLLSLYKRLLAIRLFIQKEGGETLTVSVRRDNEVDWQTAGSIVVSSQPQTILNERLPVDYRAKRFEFKVSSKSPFRFLGMEFEFLVSGER